MRIAWHSQGMGDVPSDDEWLSPVEAAWIGRMRFEKRSSEFRMGRWTAKNAVSLFLGRPCTPQALHAVEINRAPGGAPVPLVEGQPAPVAISMTDRADQAVCVVASREVGLGVDLELVEPRTDAFVSDFLTRSEQRLVGEAVDPEDRGLRANLIWCGKESALKVLRTGLRRDTRSVEVSFPDEPPVDGWATMLVRASEGTEFPGWWKRFGAFVLTVAASGPIDSPRPLVEPPGLETATPSHQWLRRSSPDRGEPVGPQRAGSTAGRGRDPDLADERG